MFWIYAEDSDDSKKPDDSFFVIAEVCLNRAKVFSAFCHTGKKAGDA